VIFSPFLFVLCADVFAVELSDAEFLRKSAFYEVELFLEEFIRVYFTTNLQSVDFDLESSMVVKRKDLIRKYISILFFFLKSERHIRHENDGLFTSLNKWLYILLEKWFLLDDTFSLSFALYHILRDENAKCFLEMLNFSVSRWTNQTQFLFLVNLDTILTPFKKRDDPERIFKSNEKQSTISLASDESAFVYSMTPNANDLVFNEADYLLILAQIPFKEFIVSLVEYHPNEQFFSKSWSFYLFGMTRAFLEIIEKASEWIRFTNFDDLKSKIGLLVCSLPWLLIKAIDNKAKQVGIEFSYQSEIDWIIVQSFKVLLIDLRTHCFLKKLPLQSLSESASFYIFSWCFIENFSRLFQDNYIPSITPNYALWIQSANIRNVNNSQFLRVLKESQEKASENFLLLSLSKIACSQKSDQLSLIFCYEILNIFDLGSLVNDRSKNEIYQQFEKISLNHPASISAFIDLIHERKEIRLPYSAQIIQNLKFENWFPSAKDDEIMKKFLTSSSDSLESQFAQQILLKIKSSSSESTITWKRAIRNFKMLYLLLEVRIFELVKPIQTTPDIQYKFLDFLWLCDIVLSLPIRDASFNFIGHYDEAYSNFDRAIRGFSVNPSMISAISEDVIIVFLELQLSKKDINIVEFDERIWPSIKNIIRKSSSLMISNLAYKLIFDLVPSLFHSNSGFICTVPILRTLLELDEHKREAQDSKELPLERVYSLIESHVHGYLCGNLPISIVSFWVAEIIASSQSGVPWYKSNNLKYFFNNLLFFVYKFSIGKTNMILQRALAALKLFENVFLELCNTCLKSTDFQNHVIQELKSDALSNCYFFIHIFFQSLSQNANIFIEFFTNLSGSAKWYKNESSKLFLEKITFLITRLLLTDIPILKLKIGSCLTSVGKFLETSDLDSILFNTVELKQNLERYPHLVLEVLFAQFNIEKDQIYKLGLLLSEHQNETLEIIVKSVNSKFATQNVFFCAARCCIELSSESKLSIFYWQFLFFLFFLNAKNDNAQPNELPNVYGFRFVTQSNLGIIEELEKKLTNMANLKINADLTLTFLQLLQRTRLHKSVEWMFNEIEDFQQLSFFYPLIYEEIGNIHLRKVWPDLLPKIDSLDEVKESVKQIYCHAYDLIDLKEDLINCEDDDSGMADLDNFLIKTVRVRKQISLLSKEVLEILDLFKCVQDSSICLEILQNSSKEFLRRLELSESLDKALVINCLPYFWRNEFKSISKWEPCQLGAAKCIGMPLFNFEYAESFVNMQYVESMKENLSIGDSCRISPEINFGLFAALSMIRDVCKFLEGEAKSDLYFESLAFDWFMRLIDLVHDKFFYFPHFSRSFISILSDFKWCISASSYDHQKYLIKVFSSFPYLLPTLIDSFNPMLYFIDFFTEVISLKGNSNIPVLKLLYRFDVESWLINNPGLADRTCVFDFSLKNALSKSYSSHIEQEILFRNRIFQIVVLMVSNDPSSFFCELIMWITERNDLNAEFFEILGNASIDLSLISWENLIICFRSLSKFFENLKGDLYSKNGAFLSGFSKFFKKLIRACLDVLDTLKHGQKFLNQSRLDVLWESSTKILKPWIDYYSNQFEMHKEALLYSLHSLFTQFYKYDPTNIYRIWNFACSFAVEQIFIFESTLEFFELFDWKCYFNLSETIVIALIDLIDRASKVKRLSDKFFIFLVRILVTCPLDSGLFLESKINQYGLAFIYLVVNVIRFIPHNEISPGIFITDWIESITDKNWNCITLSNLSNFLNDAAFLLRDPEFSLESSNEVNLDMLESKQIHTFSSSLRAHLVCKTIFKLASSNQMAKRVSQENLLFADRCERLKVFTNWLFKPFYDENRIQNFPSIIYIDLGREVLKSIDEDLLFMKYSTMDLELRCALISLLGEFIMLCNLEIDSEKSLHEFRGFKNMICKEFPSLIMFSISAAIRTVYSVKEIGNLTEMMVESLCEYKSAELEKGSEEFFISLADIFDSLSLDSVAFLNSFMENSQIYSSSLILLKTLSYCKVLSDGKDIVFKALKWIEEQSSGADEHKLFLVVSILLRWIISVTRMNLKFQESNELKQKADELVQSIQRSALSCGSEPSIAGIRIKVGLMARVGIGVSKFSSRARLAFQVVYFVLQKFSIGNHHWNWSEISDPPRSSTSDQKLQKEINDLASNLEFKEYEKELNYIVHALEDVASGSPLDYHSLSQILFSLIGETLYPSSSKYLVIR
jgi:hypothetical protein